ANTPNMPTAGCHQATPGGTATRTSINMGVALGTNEAIVEKALLGSRTTLVQQNIGTIAKSITGQSMACVSRRSQQAAPTVMNSAPYINTPSTRYTRNQASTSTVTNSA